MKIIGIGVDIIQNKRIIIALKNKTFINRTFGKQEIFYSKKILNKINYFAKRFAAKESLAKAIGTGFRDGLRFKDIQVLNNKLGKPYYILDKKLKTLISNKRNIKNFDLFLSISDEKEYSIAFTMIQSIK